VLLRVEFLAAYTQMSSNSKTSPRRAPRLGCARVYDALRGAARPVNPHGPFPRVDEPAQFSAMAMYSSIFALSLRIRSVDERSSTTKVGTQIVEAFLLFLGKRRHAILPNPGGVPESGGRHWVNGSPRSNRRLLPAILFRPYPKLNYDLRIGFSGSRIDGAGDLEPKPRPHDRRRVCHLLPAVRRLLRGVHGGRG